MSNDTVVWQLLNGCCSVVRSEEAEWREQARGTDGCSVRATSARASQRTAHDNIFLEHCPASQNRKFSLLLIATIAISQLGHQQQSVPCPPNYFYNNCITLQSTCLKMLARTIVKNVAKRTMRIGAKAVAQPLASYSSAAVAMKEVQSPYTRVAEMARREIDFEVTGAEVDVEHEDAKKIVEKFFTIHEEKGKGEVILTRTHNDEKIQVFFHVQDVEDESMFDEEEAEESEEEGVSNIGVNFRVDITRGDKKMIIAAVGGQELDVRAVRFVPANADRNNEEIYYGGPEFSELEEDFQEAFLDYLEERKIDGDLAFFVLSHSREKEQKEYVNWLETLESFSAK